MQEAKEYASIAGTLLYRALDPPDSQFAVGRLMSAVTKPQRKHLAMMKHCLRYMVGRRCCAWKFEYQEWPGELVILTDALLMAESGFDGVVRGEVSGIQLRETFMQFGFSVRLRVLLDSSAARAMSARTGSGRVKHVEARYLWVQDGVRKKQFSVGSTDTSHNTPDLGTKIHSGERLQELVRMMPTVVGEFEPTKLWKKLLGALFLASQVGAG